jgi:hypothetical protein
MAPLFSVKIAEPLFVRAKIEQTLSCIQEWDRVGELDHGSWRFSATLIPTDGWPFGNLSSEVEIPTLNGKSPLCNGKQWNKHEQSSIYAGKKEMSVSFISLTPDG